MWSQVCHCVDRDLIIIKTTCTTGRGPCNGADFLIQSPNWAAVEKKGGGVTWVCVCVLLTGQVFWLINNPCACRTEASKESENSRRLAGFLLLRACAHPTAESLGATAGKGNTSIVRSCCPHAPREWMEYLNRPGNFGFPSPRRRSDDHRQLLNHISMFDYVLPGVNAGLIALSDGSYQLVSSSLVPTEKRLGLMWLRFWPGGGALCSVSSFRFAGLLMLMLL